MSISASSQYHIPDTLVAKQSGGRADTVLARLAATYNLKLRFSPERLAQYQIPDDFADTRLEDILIRICRVTRSKYFIGRDGTVNNYYALLGPELTPPARGDFDPIAFLEAQPDINPTPDIYATAAMSADRGCAKCEGRGVYRRGENALAICDLCCKHNQGWWRLEESYGPDNGRWACKAGCGVIVDCPAPELEFLPRAVVRG